MYTKEADQFDIPMNSPGAALRLRSLPSEAALHHVQRFSHQRCSLLNFCGQMREKRLVISFDSSDEFRKIGSESFKIRNPKIKIENRKLTLGALAIVRGQDGRRADLRAGARLIEPVWTGSELSTIHLLSSFDASRWFRGSFDVGEFGGADCGREEREKRLA